MSCTEINWKLIFALSLLGLAMGMLSLVGLGMLKPVLWLIIFTIYAWIIATRASRKYFLHGFLVAALSEVWITTIHAYYLFDISRNQPGMVEVLPGGMNPQVINIIIGIVAGIIMGTIGGLFAFVAARMLKKDRAPESEAIR